MSDKTLTVGDVLRSADRMWRCATCPEYGLHGCRLTACCLTSEQLTIHPGRMITVPSPPPCTWSQNAEGNWETSCDEVYCIADGTPAENRMKFCTYCGLPVVEKVYEEEDEG